MEKKIFSFYSIVELPDELRKFINDNENIQFTVRTLRDYAIITDKRILISEKQGLTGTTVDYYTIPYRSILTYSIEMAGWFDLNSQLKLVLNGGTEVEIKFYPDKQRESCLHRLYEVLNDYVL